MIYLYFIFNKPWIHWDPLTLFTNITKSKRNLENIFYKTMPIYVFVIYTRMSYILKKNLLDRCLSFIFFTSICMYMYISINLIWSVRSGTHQYFHPDWPPRDPWFLRKIIIFNLKKFKKLRAKLQFLGFSANRKNVLKKKSICTFVTCF